MALQLCVVPVMRDQGVQEGTLYTAWRGYSAQGQVSPHQEVQDPVATGEVEPQDPDHWDELSGHDCVDC